LLPILLLAVIILALGIWMRVRAQR